MEKQYITKATVATFVLAGSVAAVAPAPAEAAATFKDVKRSAAYYKAVTEFAKAGYISGYADQTFKPELEMTRGQFVTILARVLNLNTSNNAPTYFVDMDSKNSFNGAAVALADFGVDVSYEDGSFQPREFITRYEAAAMLTQSYGLVATKKLTFTDVGVAHENSIKAVVENGVMTGISNKKFNGDSTLTRGMAVQALYLAHETKSKQKDIELTISEVTSLRVVTDEDVSYKIADDLKGIFRTVNEAALQGAVVKVKVQNGTIIGVSSIQLNTENTRFSSKGATIPTLIINANAVRVYDTTVSKQLTITDEASNSVTLENTKINGILLVADGYGDLQLTLKNTTPSAIEINRDDTTIQSNKTLAKMGVGAGVYDLTLNTKLKQLNIPAGIYLDLFGYTTIDKVNLGKSSDMDLRYSGLIKELNLTDKDSSIYLRTNALLGKVIIPKNADHTDIFSPYSLVSSTVSQISYLGTMGNIIAPSKPIVFNPVNETYDNALARAVVGFSASAVKNELFAYTTFGTFNEVRLIDANIDASVKLVSGLENLPATTEYTLNIKRNGKVMTSKKVALSTIRQGARVSAITGIPTGKLLDYKNMSQDQWTVEIAELNKAVVLDLGLLVKNKTIRTTRVSVPGKLSDESVMTAAVTSFTGTPDTIAKNKFTVETQFGQIYSEYLFGKKVDVLLKLNGTIAGAKDTDEYTIIASRNGTAYAAKKITVAELKAGKLASAIIAEAAKDITSFVNNSKDAWTFEIVELFGAAKIDAQLQVGGQVTKSTLIALIGNSVPDTFADVAKATIASFSATATSNKLNVKTAFSRYFDTAKLGDATLDTKVTIPSKDLDTLPAGETYEVKITQGTTVKTATVKSDDLKATGGVLKLSDLLGGAGKLANHTPGATDNWDIEITGLNHTINTKLELMATKGSEIVVLGTQNVAIQPTADLVTVMKNAVTGFTVTADKNIATIKTTFGAIDETKLAKAKVDARLQLTTAITDKTYKVNIKYGTTDLGIKNVSYADLQKGINLSKILDTPAANLVGHSGTDTWTVEVLNLHDDEAKLNVDLLVNNTPVRSQEDIVVKKTEAFIAAVGKAITKFEVPLKVADATFDVKTTFGTLDDTDKQRLQGATLDTMVKLTSGFTNEDSKTVAVSIQYKETAPVTKFVKIGDLREGKKLSAILGSDPAQLASHSGTDEWKITILDAPPAGVTLPSSLTEADLTKLTKEATISLQLVVDHVLFGKAKSLSLGMKYWAISDAIKNFEVTQANTIFTVKTTFGSIRPEDLTESTLDAHVKALATDTGKIQVGKTYVVDIHFNGETYPVTVTGQQLIDGINLSELLGTEPALLKNHKSTTTDTWALDVKNLDLKDVSFTFELLVSGQAVKTQTVAVKENTFTFEQAAKAAITGFTAKAKMQAKENIINVETRFGRYFDTAKLGDAILDTKITIPLSELATLPNQEKYAMDIAYQGTSVGTATLTVEELKKNNGIIKLSELLELGAADLVKLADHTPDATDEWEMAITGVNHSLTAKLDLIATKDNKDTVLRTQTVNLAPSELAVTVNDVIKDFEVGQKNNVFTLKTLFGAITPAKLSDAEILDARIMVDAKDADKLNNGTYVVDIILDNKVNASQLTERVINTHPVEITKSQLLDGVKISELLDEKLLLTHYKTGETANWKMVVKNLDATNATFNFDLLVGERTVRNAKPIAVNLPYSTAVKGFEAVGEDNKLTVTTDFGTVTNAEKYAEVDAKITIPSAKSTRPDRPETFTIKITYSSSIDNSSTVMVNSKTVALDKNGSVLLSTVLGGKGTLADHVERTDTWIIEILSTTSLENVVATVDLLVGENTDSDKNIVRTVENILVPKRKP